MSEFRFICPFCDAPLDCPEELDGVETECPICNEKIVPVSQPLNKISVTDENNEESEEQKKLNYERLKSELNEQKEQERDIPRLEIEIPIEKQSVFIAKCPACKKDIEFDKELKYSKQQCPFCNKTVILKTTKKQDGECQNRDEDAEKDDLNTLSPKKQYNTHLCRHCKNIIIIESTLSNNFACCPCCQKDVFLSKENVFFMQKDQSLEDFISLVKRKAIQDNKRVFVLPSNTSINNTPPPNKHQTQDAVSDTAIGCVAIIGCILILIGLGSCIASCDTSTEMSEEAKTYLMLKEAQDRLKEERKERAIKNLMDIMDRGY